MCVCVCARASVVTRCSPSLSSGNLETSSHRGWPGQALKCIKKASGAKTLRRGVKEVVKALKKDTKGLCIIAGAPTVRVWWVREVRARQGPAPPQVTSRPLT